MGFRRLHLAAAAALLLAVACAQLPTRPPLGLEPEDKGAAIAPPSTTRFSPGYSSPGARLVAFDLIWRNIGKYFYDANMHGVDWKAVREQYEQRVQAATSDAELYQLFKAMAAELKDSHTTVLTPAESVAQRAFRFTQVGINLLAADNEIFVSEVAAGFPAERAGVRPGMVLLAFNGTRLDDPSVAEPLPQGQQETALAHKLRALNALQARANKDPLAPVALQFFKADNTVWDIALAAETKERAPTVKGTLLPSGVAVVQFDRFVKEVQPQLESIFGDAMRHHAQALILDLRGNGGGLVDTYIWLMTQLLPEQKLVMQIKSRAESGQNQVINIKPKPVEHPFAVPIAILVDRRTASAAELTANTLVEQRGAVVVGEPSCGCVVGVRQEFVLPDNGGLRVSERAFVTAGGNMMEGKPLQPTVRSNHTLADLRANRDRVVFDAEQLLISKFLAPRQARSQSALPDGERATNE